MKQTTENTAQQKNVTNDVEPQAKKQYVKPEMTEQKPLDRATTTVYYFYE